MKSASTPYVIDVRTESEPAELFLSTYARTGICRVARPSI